MKWPWSLTIKVKSLDLGLTLNNGPPLYIESRIATANEVVTVLHALLHCACGALSKLNTLTLFLLELNSK